MLATTDGKLLKVMRESSFGSVSQFHAVIKKLVGSTPRGYRTSLRTPA